MWKAPFVNSKISCIFSLYGIILKVQCLQFYVLMIQFKTEGLWNHVKQFIYNCCTIFSRNKLIFVMDQVLLFYIYMTTSQQFLDLWYKYMVMVWECIVLMSFQHASDGVVRYNVRTNLRSEEINPNISLKALVQPVRYGTYQYILSRICGDKFLCGFCGCPSTTNYILDAKWNTAVIH